MENQTETQARQVTQGKRSNLKEPASPAERPVTSTVATVVIAAAAVALIEVDWIPGLLIGVGAMLAPKAFPNLGRSMRPLIKGAVKAGMSIADSSRSAWAEAQEEIEDIIAEVKAERPHTETRTASDGDVVH
jgi:hypothetical protein